VLYSTPLDELPSLAAVFFERCLAARVTPFVVTKRTVFKWQEPFWTAMQSAFDERGYGARFAAAGLLARTGGKLGHLLTDAAAMALVQWREGGFGMVAHNYDGDVLTDLLAAVHGSPALVCSCLIGDLAGELRPQPSPSPPSPVPEGASDTAETARPMPLDDVARTMPTDAAGGEGAPAPSVGLDGDRPPPIKLFEACHGTASDLWERHLRSEPTRFDPTGLCYALFGAMDYACEA
jgi:isocitrate dehydrogenase